MYADVFCRSDDPRGGGGGRSRSMKILGGKHMIYCHIVCKKKLAISFSFHLFIFHATNITLKYNNCIYFVMSTNIVT